MRKKPSPPNVELKRGTLSVDASGSPYR